MTVERDRSRVFGEVADEYDRIRPGYPDALVDDVLAYARLADGAAVIEAGAGTGKATAAFAERGVTITAVEPDEAMAIVLSRRLADRPAVTVVNSTFEEHQPDRRYGLLFSAQAWHWTDPAVRWRRAADVLTPGGALALFWNSDRPGDPEVVAAMVAAHQRFAPQVEVPTEGIDEATLAGEWPGLELAGLPEFGDLSERLYRWERSLSTADFLALLATYSAYRILDGDVRDELLRSLEESLGDRVTLLVDTVLYLARRRPG